MEIYSQHYIRGNKSEEKPKVLIVTDENPKGVTLTVKDNSDDGSMTSFSLPRLHMIEALEYIVAKLKAV